MRAPVYLDHHATTPLDPRVLDSMMPYLTDKFGNASSMDHAYGHAASVAVEEARARVAGLINARPADMVFTGGATESDNMALVGAMARYRDRGDHLITCETEHAAVLDTARHLESQGTDVTYLPVDEFGSVDPGAVRDAITDRTVLVSIMAANNEIGTLADLAAIGRITRAGGVLFHTDAAQAAGYVPLDVEAMNIDLMSISAHKMYGPKGVGALYVRGSTPRVRPDPLVHGGGQERGLRSGTLNVPAIVGFGRAAEIVKAEMQTDAERFRVWSEKMAGAFEAAGGKISGHPRKKLPHNVCVRFPRVDGKAIINTVSETLAISAGSACTTRSVEPSHVLLATGLDEEDAHSAIRIGLGRFNTDDDVGFAVEKIVSAAESLSSMNADTGRAGAA